MLGLVLTVFGGLLQGSFTVPMKFAAEWRWENIWLVFSVVGLLLAPWVFAYSTVPSYGEVLSNSDFGALSAASVFGAGWGAGNVMFGLGVARLGAALGFAIILGMTSAIGAIAPLVLLRPEEVFSPAGKMILVGVFVVLVGIVLTARAGQLKEQALKEASQEGAAHQAFLPGLILCLLSGVTSPMLNFSLTFGEDIANQAKELGAAASANNAIWAPAVSSGAVINILFCLWLLKRNRTTVEFRRGKSAKPWLLAISMGIMWMGGVAAYGMGAAALGPLGPSLGWPVFMSTIIITANVWGALTGEWRGSGQSALKWMIASLVVLSAAIFVFGYSSTLQ